METYKFLRVMQETIPQQEVEIRRQASAAVAAMKPRSLKLLDILGTDDRMEGQDLDWSFGMNSAAFHAEFGNLLFAGFVMYLPVPPGRLEAKQQIHKLDIVLKLADVPAAGPVEVLLALGSRSDELKIELQRQMQLLEWLVAKWGFQEIAQPRAELKRKLSYFLQSPESAQSRQQLLVDAFRIHRIAASLPDLLKALQLMKFDWALQCELLQRLEQKVADLGTKEHVNVVEDAAARL
eukprot:Skav224821  [mRNA]  locus=scaffold613:153429:159889:- [translate_table: standard]